MSLDSWLGCSNNLQMTPEEIIKGITRVCAVVIVNADHSDSLLLKQLLLEDRAIFVSTAIHIAIRIEHIKPKVREALDWQKKKLSPQELANTIKPNNCVTDADFALRVKNEVECLLSTE